MTNLSDIKSKIDQKVFTLPLIQENDIYFPDFIKNKLDEWIGYYDLNFKQLIDNGGIINTSDRDSLYNRIRLISAKLSESIDLYYKGFVKDSYLAFEDAMSASYFDSIKPITEIKIGTDFYRARIDDSTFFKAKDLFHVGFEKRHLVKTTRYSIPGLPALYTGDSSYVCWEEFERHPIEKLWYTRLENQKNLNIISIQRIEDLFRDIDSLIDSIQIMHLLRYFVLFPLILTCSVKVKYKFGSFKPEYIIPQFLMQYISTKEDIDGLKYMSTKVDYKNLGNVPAYNYVFPVKDIKNKGYCNILKDTFFLTEPTSIEIENTLFNPEYTGVVYLDNENYIPEMTISLAEGDTRDYKKTSFGRIERKLKNSKRNIKRLDL